MRYLVTLCMVVLMAACAGPRVSENAENVSFIYAHCSEHAADFMDFATDRFNECVELHEFGLVKTDSTDEHLSVLHY